MLLNARPRAPATLRPPTLKNEPLQRVGLLRHSGGRRQSGRASKACSAVNAVAAWTTSPGTQSGNGVSILRCAPEAVCTSSIEASLAAGIRSLTRTRAGHTRRWTSVTLPFTRRKRTTSGESDNSLITPKIAWLAGWPHQLPVIGSPPTSSATFGIGPRADSRSTPCSTSSAMTSTIRTDCPSCSVPVAFRRTRATLGPNRAPSFPCTSDLVKWSQREPGWDVGSRQACQACVTLDQQPEHVGVAFISADEDRPHAGWPTHPLKLGTPTARDSARAAEGSLAHAARAR
jgi:hypothetical protein